MCFVLDYPREVAEVPEGWKPVKPNISFKAWQGPNGCPPVELFPVPADKRKLVLPSLCACCAQLPC